MQETEREKEKSVSASDHVAMFRLLTEENKKKVNHQIEILAASQSSNQ